MDKLGLDLDDGTVQPTQANPQVIYAIIFLTIFFLSVIVTRKKTVYIFFLSLTGSEKVIHTEMYTFFGSRVPMSRRELPITKLSAYEARRTAYESLQDEGERQLPHMQAADRFVFLSREILSSKCTGAHTPAASVI